MQITNRPVSGPACRPDSGAPARAAARRWLAPATMAALALALSAGTAPASYPRPGGCPGWNEAAQGSLVDVQVLVEGQSAPLYQGPHASARFYFEAFPGRHYALRITNRTGGRVGVLISVDGLNVVNGERSGLDRNEPMYVLDPWETATIRGWRTSLEQVREFVFVDEERSYAARTDQANGDMGWIRLLAFEEQRPLAWYGRPWIRDGHGEPRAKAEDRGREGEARGAAPQALDERAPSRAEGEGGDAPAGKSGGDQAGPSASQNKSYPGTGWGDRRHDPVRETYFTAVSRPSDNLVFRYEYAHGLEALGIDPAGDRLWDRERGGLGFARPPRW